MFPRVEAELPSHPLSHWVGNFLHSRPFLYPKGLPSPHVEIAELMKVPRSTVQYRRTSSFELLKRYLEERADEWDEL